METKVYLISLLPFREKNPTLSKRQLERSVGEWAVKTVISLELDCPAEQLEICRKGKPFIKNRLCEFNLSHSGEYLALAVGSVPLGIDIEKITKIRPKVMETYFSKTEQERVEKEGVVAFFEIWTQKESYVKYTGEGTKGLKSTSDYSENVCFYTKRVGQYQLCVCAPKRNLPVKIEDFKLCF